ncbi:hypothetical protein IEQ34_026422 [Dendrobium chrysotoxum]|uniref:CRIB domain-containing protein n=1 Tax=Dendrobium chrysotoxum TaxID=161865 RepID=A0AAV7FMH6_DENCH|nr:hypothetical protein IEQ34_026422 [Dendrobium chrysotoxum]
MELLEGKVDGESLPKGSSSFLTTKMKGIFKGFKFISQIFVFKEPEMVIGYPTDVKHVAHIGYSSSSNIPSWMAEFNTASDFSSGVFGESRGLSWASHEFDQPNGFQLSPGKFSEKSCPDAGAPKKKRKKFKFASSSSSIRSIGSHASPIDRTEQAQSVMA